MSVCILRCCHFLYNTPNTINTYNTDNTYHTYNAELTCTLSLFLLRSEFWQFRIFIPLTGAPRQRNTRCSIQSAAILSTYCVYLQSRDCPHTTGIGCFAQGVTVLHFRKVVNRQEIGSPENRCSVIYRRGYQAANYHCEKTSRQGKSSGVTIKCVTG